LGCGAHLSALRRLKIGPFEVGQAVTLPVLDARVTAGEPLAGAWIPFDQIPLPFGEVTADPQQEQRISHGQTVLVRELAGEEGDWVKLINRRQELIAVGTVIERIGSAGVGIVQPKVVFR
jgi:tRNA pseudouridine55 synthase